MAVVVVGAGIAGLACARSTIQAIGSHPGDTLSRLPVSHSDQGA